MSTGPNLNVFAFDYVTRNKLQSTSLNWYIVEQLPMIPPAAYGQTFGVMTAGDLVADHVLRLTYTAHDMADFARDMGYVDDDGAPKAPFIWDEGERRHLKARLDALYFLLYGISMDDADYILSTFPIVRAADEKAFGKFVTRDLILAYMRALSAGDVNTQVAV